MRGLGQIAELCAIARPDVAVVTSIGPEHLELVGSVENVARANAEAIAALPPGGIAVVPGGCPRARALPASGTDIDVRRFDPPTSSVSSMERAQRGGASTSARPSSCSSCRSRSATGREHARGARRLRRARAAARPRARGRGAHHALALARRGDRPARRRLRRQRRLQREPALDAGRAGRPRRARRRAGDASRFSERWPSSATEAARYHREIGALVASSPSTCSSPSVSRRAAYMEPGVDEMHWIADAASFDDRRGRAPARGRRAREGLACRRARRHPGPHREDSPAAWSES